MLSTLKSKNTAKLTKNNLLQKLISIALTFGTVQVSQTVNVMSSGK